ncbi:class I SAM-dependent methyltransferase [Streptomyces sp. ATCC51928]|uniref:Class I SAM-dependent methyltransferase n=1 Tax=Streptomyces caviscabies TaxID=90079 RepID=A0ABW2MNG6_9ACTN|nr:MULTISPECIES: class I SAM-dependent methyltransferase [unclassified Streptomyces]MDX3504059.1 class I SAM-dependent methyltransferase [Streptomyces sp. ATCC51928]MDX5524886.1 class I SAM-dependent methyltransferase [Streptomyces sp. DE06-01C]
MGDSQGRVGEGHGSPAAVVFDALGAEYEQAFASSAAHRESLDRLLADLAPGSRVLDVGSGTGRPTARTLADAGHRVLGVDVSPVMTALAARQVPGAEFRCADIRDLPLTEGEFDAVCVYFSLLQLSRGEQGELLERLARSLRPGGLLAVATVPVDVADVDAVFMGQPVRVSSFGAEEFTALTERAGVVVEWTHSALFTPDHPAGAPEPHFFVHGRRI